MAAAMGGGKVERMSSIDAQLRMLVPAKVSEDDKLIEYDALLLDSFLDVLQGLHGDDLREMVCVVKAPGFGENRRANLDDMVVLTGGEVVSEDRGLDLGKVQLQMLGTAKKVTVSLDDTIIYSRWRR